MAAMDEIIPGQKSQYPTPTSGTPDQNAFFQMLLQKFGGAPTGATGMPPDGVGSSGGGTAAVTPLAGLAGSVVGTGAPSMPPGVPGVRPSNLTQPASGPNTRPMPGPNAMLGGDFAFPNKSARNAAVVSTGIENISEAIHNFKAEKDKNDFVRAKNTWDLYQKAAAVDPQTGKPVDPHTMSILAQDPKIVKGWEKYLKMEFPREQGATDPKTGKPTHTPPIIPQPTADPAAQIKALTDQRALTQLRNVPGETGHLTPEESHKKEMIDAGITPSQKDTKAMDKIDAEIANLKSEKLQHEADIARLEAETVRLGPNDPL